MWMERVVRPVVNANQAVGRFGQRVDAAIERFNERWLKPAPSDTGSLVATGCALAGAWIFNVGGSWTKLLALLNDHQMAWWWKWYEYEKFVVIKLMAHPAYVPVVLALMFNKGIGEAVRGSWSWLMRRAEAAVAVHDASRADSATS